MSRVDKLVARARRIVDGHRESQSLGGEEMRRRLIEKLHAATEGKGGLASQAERDETAPERDRVRDLIERARSAKATEADDNGEA